MTSKPAILIAGPTASGKSSIALEVAEALGGVIINADSMQIYENLDIITARPGRAEMEAAPHALFGILDGANHFSVAEWLILAKAEAGKAWKSGKIPIFTGGTGLYFKTLTQGLVDVPEISQGVRSQLRQRLENEGIKALYQDLEVKDPETARRLKPADKQRIIRALEVFEATGEPLSRWLRKTSENPFKGVEFVKICLLAGPEVLNQRILARFHNMIEKGALKEAANFAVKGIDPSRPVMKALGLRPLLRHLKGEFPIEQATRLAAVETRQYAKRQRTWFRGQFADWTFLEAGDDTADKILLLAEDAFRD